MKRAADFMVDKVDALVITLQMIFYDNIIRTGTYIELKLKFKSKHNVDKIRPIM